jgi:dolichyl-phosphate-mannose-protein mannosyltransferase
MVQLNQYVTQFTSANAAIPTTPTPSQATPPAKKAAKKEEPKQQSKQEVKKQKHAEVKSEEPKITSSATQLRSTKARVEYRDQQGNILDEDVVESLRKEGKVSFETRHETRTRLAQGHLVDMVDGEIAPPHPDVEGQNPETLDKPEEVAEDSPASAAGAESLKEEVNSPEPKPASEGNDATL